MRPSKRSAALTFAALCGSLLVSGAHAVVVDIDQFSVFRNGAEFFTDTFSDGNPPPSAPGFPIGTPRQYGVFGTFTPNIEANDVLQLNSAAGGLTQNAPEQDRLTLRAALNTNTDSSNLADGLKIDDTLSLLGIFSLTSPTGPLINGYGIRFSDRNASGVNQIAELDVRFNPATGKVEVRYILQDFVANQITEFGQADFAPPNGADQILLQIARPVTGFDGSNYTDTNFFATYSYLQGGNVVGGSAFAKPISLFQGESFVRAEFHAFEALPAPEPSTMWLLSGAFMALAGGRFVRPKSRREGRDRV
jgi:hypothetical protein